MEFRKTSDVSAEIFAVVLGNEVYQGIVAGWGGLGWGKMGIWKSSRTRGKLWKKIYIYF